MNSKICALFAVVLIATAEADAQQAPIYHMPRYFPECWRGADAYPADGWTTDIYPDTGLFATVEMMSSEPAWGYPLHSGVAIGVSDTVEMQVRFHNRNQTAYNTSSVSPEIWFTPAIWPIGVDIWRTPPLTLPATFGWRFDCWEEDLSQISKPPYIYSESDVVNIYDYDLVYYCWGLPAGRYVLTMIKTAQAPSYFRLLRSDDLAVWTVNPTSSTDTLNGYAACYKRAYRRHNYSAAGYWAGQILAKNQFSIPGHLFKADYFYGIGDTSSYHTMLDSALAIIYRYGDSLLPDSAHMTGPTETWYEDVRNNFELRRYNFLNTQHPYYP